MSTDPIVLAAQARLVIQKLHKREDIIVRFKTDSSGYAEDALDELDRKAPGHFKPDKNLLTLNLDELLGHGKPLPVKLDSIEDFRLYPVLAGVTAHEAGHARWSLWNDIPGSIPNPDFDPFAPSDDEGKNPTGPESFPITVSGNLFELAGVLEEPRIERLGSSTFTKTWRRAMQFSAGHLILEQVGEMDADGKDPLDAAVRMAVLVGGRVTAGTLGSTYESRKAAKVVMDSAQSIIEKSVAEFEPEHQTADPFHAIMGIINAQVFSNDHDDAISHLEAARQILKIVHPQKADDPDQNSGSGSGDEDEDEDEGDKGDGTGTGAVSEAMKAMQDAMGDALGGLSDTLSKMVISEEEAPEKPDAGGGHGSTLYKNPKAPQIDHYEQPTADDRELYRRALDWMQRQVEPTVTESAYGQWLPVGGARLNIRSKIRDDLAGLRGSQRTDWDRVSETVKPAPPMKVAIMLDGSGSMRRMARPSASIAWAAANAAAALPESRTVSVVYGDAAQVTQAPGHMPARQVAVSRTDGGTEEFVEAAKMVEDALWLDVPTEEGEKSNVLIVIVSDLMYGGEYVGPTGKRERQMDSFFRIVEDWTDRGYQVAVVGASGDSFTGYASDKSKARETAKKLKRIEPKDLFR